MQFKRIAMMIGEIEEFRQLDPIATVDPFSNDLHTTLVGKYHVFDCALKIFPQTLGFSLDCK